MTADAAAPVRAERRGPVLLIAIDRPEARNALSPAIVAAVAGALKDAEADGATHAAVITGGARDFSAGADIDVLSGHSPASYLGSETRRAFRAIGACELPVVAAVAGYCLGGGCELALACDVIVAADTAVFGQPEINLGLMPGAGGTQLWRRRAGSGPQAECALAARFVGAYEARRIGLVDAVVPAACVVEAALERAAAIAAKAPLAARATKAALRAADAMPGAAALEHEVALMAGLLATDDAREGTRAFREKRAPNFRGR